jgi:acyl carrier protein
VSRRDIERRARLVIVLELACDPAKVMDRADFRKDLGADSLDMARLPRALEDEFGIRLTDHEVAFCETVGTALDLIETKIENRRVA